ncbi:uncharacterized protein LOC110694817 [Chenopodium quinoa]|uniref:uncharacterized protein LOC110694817 n=1 Tax=Chenopodium quinoa TaxID=63459 RepID=UPI000B779485|nr:uncharacterized protein LOC110694817 [Chenopodium quinoa]
MKQLQCNAKKFAYKSLHFCCGNGDVRIAANEYPAELTRLFTSQEEIAIHFRKYARLRGQLYHFVPDLLPADSNPKYLQLYFYDGQNETENRLGCFPELRQEVIDILMNVSKDNPCARFFQSLKEVEVNEDTKIVINRDTVLDQRVYNAPASNEVAVIWPDNTSSSESLGPHILVSGNQLTLIEFSIITVHLVDIHTKADKFVSPREYYAYKLQIRPNNVLLRTMLQYIVDMYVKIENTRLDFFRRHQDSIRADLYQGILDTVEAREINPSNVGHKFVLPPTFLGGPRDLKRRYYNAMALVHRFGKPDLFITMTCNANWPEKRGLPHAHILLILKLEFKLKSPADYDKYVSAEIPPLSNPILHRIVLKHMMHGPCGRMNPQCSCMQKKGEICSTIKAVKFLYKYVYKGHDKVSFNIKPDGRYVADEITKNQLGRQMVCVHPYERKDA